MVWAGADVRAAAYALLCPLLLPMVCTLNPHPELSHTQCGLRYTHLLTKIRVCNDLNVLKDVAAATHHSDVVSELYMTATHIFRMKHHKICTVQDSFSK